MSNLTNLYISQSFQGLVNLATTAGITPGTFTSFQDGLGVNLGVQVNGLGAVSASSFTGSLFGTASQAITASYALNAAGNTINTGSFVTTSSFNTFTASIQSQVSSLTAATSSYITNSQTSSMSVATASYVLNAVSASAAISSSFSLSSSISNTSISASNAQTASYVLNAVSSSFVTSASLAQTASYVLNAVSSSLAATASFITASKVWGPFGTSSIESASFAISSSIAVSSSFATTASYIATASYALQALSSSYASNAELLDGLNSTAFAQLNQNNVFAGVNNFGIISASNAYVISASIDYLSVIYQTSSIIFSSGSNVFGDNANDTQTLWGTVDIKTGPVIVSGSLNVSQGITGSLLGTASFASNSNNANTASYVLNAVSASYALNARSASYALNATTASYATTSSNIQGGSQYYIPLWNTNTSLSSSFLYQDGSLLKSIYNGNDNGLYLDFDATLYQFGSLNTGTRIEILLEDLSLKTPDGTNLVISGQNTLQNIKTQFQNNDNGLYLDFANYQYKLGDFQGLYSGTKLTLDDGSGRIDLSKDTYITGSLTVSGITNVAKANVVTYDTTTGQLFYQSTSSLNVTSASVAQTASYVVNAISSSLALTASFVNPLNQSFVITGSVQGNVISGSIASSTASLDFSRGNFFTSLVSGSTFFNIQNPRPGQTVNLLISTLGAASATFSSNVRQVSGSRYTPTSGSNLNDIITFISWDGTTVYLANVKNLI